jgi:hypothetical protein
MNIFRYMKRLQGKLED